MKNFYLSFLFFLLCACGEEKLILNGYVEADYIYVAPTSSANLRSLYVHRGDYIQGENKLFELEDVELKTVIENAKADIFQAEAILKESNRAYLRAQKLMKNNFASLSEFEQREADYKTSKAKLDIALQNLIAAEKKLKDSAPEITGDFYVENTFFVPGEFVSAGKPVVSLLSLKNIKIRFFVPQSILPKIKESEHVMVSCDGCREKIKAKISYISSQAEYTPPVIYSTESRQKIVFMVEARPDEEANGLHPGLPVDVEIEGK